MSPEQIIVRRLSKEAFFNLPLGAYQRFNSILQSYDDIAYTPFLKSKTFWLFLISHIGSNKNERLSFKLTPVMSYIDLAMEKIPATQKVFQVMRNAKKLVFCNMNQIWRQPLNSTFNTKLLFMCQNWENPKIVLRQPSVGTRWLFFWPPWKLIFVQAWWWQTDPFFDA